MISHKSGVLMKQNKYFIHLTKRDMKKRFFSLAFFLTFIDILTGRSMLSQVTSAKIKVGSEVPDFALRDQNGNIFNLKDVLGKENLVIYFYVKDETPGCTTEACTFRDQYDAFKQADAGIIGISAQSVESHKKFAENNKLQFTLLSDPDDSVRKMFGVKAGPFPGRVTFVVDKNGKVVYIFNSQTQPARHVSEAIRILKDVG
jgi:peroxiredoxin Q/BCP